MVERFMKIELVSKIFCYFNLGFIELNVIKLRVFVKASLIIISVLLVVISAHLVVIFSFFIVIPALPFVIPAKAGTQK